MGGYVPSLEHYGTHDDSAYPELWEGCIGAWAPCLGHSGNFLFDFSRRYGANLVNSTIASRVTISGGRGALFCDPTIHPGILSTCYSEDTFPGFSFSGWASPNSFSNYRVLVGTDPPAYTSGGFQVDFDIGNGFIRFVHQNIVVMCNSGRSAELNTWCHIVASYRPGKQELFVDGKLVGSGTTTFSRISGPLRLFSFGNGVYPMSGYVDDYIFYNRYVFAEEASLLARNRGIAYTPRRPRRFYSFADTFNRRRRLLFSAGASL